MAFPRLAINSMANHSYTILLVDSANNCHGSVCQKLLNQETETSFQVLTSTYEDSVLERCQPLAVDVVLVESYLPENQGLTLIEEYVKSCSDKAVASIVIGDDDVDSAKKAIKAGAADYLVRERLDADALEQAILAAIAMQKGTNDAANHESMKAALREVEENYHALRNSIDPGYALIEVLYDEKGQAIDILYVEANSAAEQMTGTKMVGQRALTIFPELESRWIETFDRVARTGIGEYLEYSVAPLNAWYRVHMYKIGLPESRRVGAIFQDVTERRRTAELIQNSAALNEFRVNLLDAIRTTSDPEAIKAAANQLLGLYLKANRVHYFEICGDYYLVEAGYNTGVSAVPSGKYLTASYGPELIRRYRQGQTIAVADVSAEPYLNPEQLSSYRELQIAAHLTVPLLREGEFVAGLSINMAEPREWTPEEIAIVKEVAERIWATIERARIKATIAADLKNMRSLRNLSAHSISENNIQTLYDEIVETAISLTSAKGGALQMLEADTQDLILLATRDLPASLTDHCYRVSASSHTSCGLALTEHKRVFIDFDVPEEEDPSGSLRLYREAGFLSAQSTPLVSRKGNLIGMVSTHWQTHQRPTQRELRFIDLLARQAADLIEQRQADAEREQLLVREQEARQAAEQTNRIKDNFLAVLSHELRTPLNPIIGWSQILLSKQLDETKTKWAYETIQRNAKLQIQLIDDLLDVAKILRGKLVIEESPITLSQVIEAAIEVVRTSAEAKSIALQFDPIADPQVKGSDARLQQIVWNLLSNAIKFTPTGGRIDISLDSTDSQAVITVTDTGKGIQPEFIPHLFESFRQEDTSITRQHGGLGLGLSIVKYLVDAHGGTITASSEGEGKGATFTITLPLLKTDTSQMPALVCTESVNLTGVKVLAVDDNPDAREILDVMLSIHGAEVKTAVSGADLLADFDDFDPDVLLCDIGMPDMDGFTLLRHVRALPSLKGDRVPVIAITAYAQVEDRQRILSSGFQRYLTKPIDSEELANAIYALV